LSIVNSWKILIQKLIYQNQQFIQFCIVGASGALVNTGLLYFFKEVLGIWYVYGAIISTLTSFCTNYILNRLWTFHNSPEKSFLRGLIKYLAVSFIAFAINISVLIFLTEIIGLWYLFSLLIGILFSMLWNFFMNRKWTFQLGRKLTTLLILMNCCMYFATSSPFIKFGNHNPPKISFQQNNNFFIEHDWKIEIDNENLTDLMVNILPNNQTLIVGTVQMNPDNLDAYIGIYDLSNRQILKKMVIGGTRNETVKSIYQKNNDILYIIGTTTSPDFPITNNAFQKDMKGIFDVFIAMINISTMDLIYSTYFGGIYGDYPVRIINNAANELIIAGYTRSPDLPITQSSFQSTVKGGYDIFIAIFNFELSDLIYSSYYGGSDYDAITDVIIDSDGNIILIGNSDSSDFPVTNDAFNPSYSGSLDCIVIKLDHEHLNPIFSTYIGDIGWDEAIGGIIDIFGNIFITGFTDSIHFPTSEDAIFRSNQGNKDVFITLLSSDGKRIYMSTYLGGSLNEVPVGIALDENFGIYIIGQTDSENFPEKYRGSLFSSPNAKVFLCKISYDGKELIWSNRFGDLENIKMVGLIIAISGELLLTIQSNKTFYLFYTHSFLDSDRDGLLDFEEFLLYETDPLNNDTDNDGMPDGWEVCHNLNPNDSNDGQLDSDNDGLSNFKEFFIGTDPNNIDTDGDFFYDGIDLAPLEVLSPNIWIASIFGGLILLSWCYSKRKRKRVIYSRIAFSHQ
jgi:putative flippase GtrA